MSIYFINRYFYPDNSATSQMLSDLCFGLDVSSQAVSVVTSRQLYEDPNAALSAIETVNKVRVHRIWTSQFGRQVVALRAIDYLTFYVSAFVFLLVNLRSGDVVTAKTDPPLISVVAAVAARCRGAKVVNWLQDVFPEVALALGMNTLKPVRPILEWLRNWSLRRASMNVVIGSRMKERLLANGIHPNQIAVIHNWADGSAIEPSSTIGNRLRTAWGLDDKFVVGYSGNMGRAHDFQTIIGAVERLKGDPAICFLFIGGGAQKEWLEQVLHTSGAESEMNGVSNVIFKPYQAREALGQSLAVADVHLASLLPALEGLIVPSKFYGIAAAGRPTIFVGDLCGEISGILSGAVGEAEGVGAASAPDFDRDSRCGIAVEVGDVDALVQAILLLKSDADLRLQMGENARRVFEQRFDKSIAMTAWVKVLKGETARKG